MPGRISSLKSPLIHLSRSMETGYLPKTKMSEFDRFLPHLKKINHRYPNLKFGTGRPTYIKKADFPEELLNAQPASVTRRLVSDGCANTSGRPEPLSRLRHERDKASA